QASVSQPQRPPLPRLLAAAFGVCLLGAALLGCSLAGPREIAFAPAKEPPAARDPDAIAKKIEADATTCRSIARQKGMSSLLAMAKSANRDNTDKDYIACMKKKGYKIE